MWKKTGLKGFVKNFSVDFNPVDTSNIFRYYLMKRTWYKIMFGLINKIFIGLLISIVNASNHKKCVSLSNQRCLSQRTLINLHPNEYCQEFHYYPFAVKLDRRVGSCITFNDLYNRGCIPNKTEDLNLRVFNMITGINDSKTLTKHLSCKCKCKFDGRKCNSDQLWNNDKCWYKCKKNHIHEKDYVWNSATCSCENGKYFMDDSAIVCDEVIDADAEAESNDETNSYNKETETVTTNFNERKQPVKSKTLLAFLNHYSIIDSC